MSATIEPISNQLAGDAEATAAAPMESEPRFFANAFRGPWLALFRLRAGGLLAARATAGGLLCSVLVHALLAAVIFLALIAYSSTMYLDYDSRWLPNPDGTASMTNSLQVRKRTFLEAAEQIGGTGPGQLNRIVLLAVIASLAVFAGTGVATVFCLPRTNPNNSFRDAVRLAFTSIVTNLPLVLLAMVVVGWYFCQMNFWRLGYIIAFQPTYPEISAIASGGVLWFAGIFIIARTARTASLLGRRDTKTELAPICESCGYDLTHVSSARRCTECGAAADDSLSDRRRGGVDWEQSRDRRFFAVLRNWFQTSQEVLHNPRTFYERLQVTTPPISAQRFALMHYVAIALFSWAWLGSLFCVDQVLHEFRTTLVNFMWLIIAAGIALALFRRLMHGVILIGLSLLFFMLLVGLPQWMSRQPDDVLWFISAVTLGLAPVCGWFVHRFIGGCVAAWWFARGELHDTRAAEKVVAYDAAYLWYPWLWFFPLLMSFILYNTWISDIIASIEGVRRTMLRGLVEPGIIVLIWGTLALFWPVRMLRNGRSVRWANR